MKASCCSCLTGCSQLSRRSFLTRAGKAAIGLGLGLEGLAAAQQRPAGTEPLIRAAFLRPPGKYWLGWPGTAYDVEGHRQEYTRLLQETASDLGMKAVLNVDPLYDEAAVAKFAEQVKATQPDGVVVTLLHIGTWPWVSTIAQAGVPTIVFAPIGTAFTGHVAGISRQPGVYVASTLDFEAVRWGLKMIRTAKQMANSRILIVAGGERNEAALERLGTNVRTVPRRTFPELFDRTPTTPEMEELAQDYFGRALRIVEPTWQDGLNAAKAYFVSRQLMAEEDANAIGMDCLGMVADREVPTPPCLAWSKLNDDPAFTAACEADLFAAVSLMFVDYLFGRPGFMQDPVPETAHNTFVGAHCTCAMRLDGFDQPPQPFILRSHAESNTGVATQVLWRLGQKVTLVRFNSPQECIVDSGTVVGNVTGPPAGGCRTSVEIEMDDVPDCRDVKGFHQVIFYGDFAKQARDFCQLYGITAVHS